MYSLELSGLEELSRLYGQDSPQYRDATAILASVLQKVRRLIGCMNRISSVFNLNSVYNNTFPLQFGEDVYGLYGNSAVVEVVTVKTFEAPLTRKSRSILESRQIVSVPDLFAKLEFNGSSSVVTEIRLKFEQTLNIIPLYWTSLVLVNVPC